MRTFDFLRKNLEYILNDQDIYHSGNDLIEVAVRCVYFNKSREEYEFNKKNFDLGLKNNKKIPLGEIKGFLSICRSDY
jgi:hypothetical protein